MKMKTAIITLDLINDICHEKGKIAHYANRISDKKIIDKTNMLTAWARNKEYLIIHVRVCFRNDYKDVSTISPIFSKAKEYNALNINLWGGQFCDELNRENGDIIVTKHRVSAFYGTDLDLILRANQINHIILLGVATNNAVELTAREAHDRDYKVTVLGDITETANDEEQKASIHFMKKIANVINSDNLY
jgi:nicotinamidase-related amidase